MKLLSALVLLFTLATALPAPQEQTASTSNKSSDLVANCQPGLTYCYAQIVNDLRVDDQTILHQYCDQQYTIDAQSCHACKRFPWPLDNCWAGEGVKKSVFKCSSGQKYDFASRCEGQCLAGRCV